MKNVIRLILSALVISGVWHPAAAQTADVGVAAEITSKPELAQLVAEYEAQEKALDAEIEPLLKEAHNKYSGDLEALSDKYNQAKRPEEADKVKKESLRFGNRGSNSEPFKDVPAEIRADWAAYLKATATANQSVTLKRNAVRAKFLQSLTALVQSYRAKNDAEGIAMARRAHAAVTIRSAIEAGRLNVIDLGNHEEEVWQDVVKEGGYVVGLEAGKGNSWQFVVLSGLRPIFATAHGIRDGEKRGKANGVRVMAKEGYAVGGLQVRSAGAVNSIQIMFMRINPDGISLNTQDFYVTEWMGGEGGGKARELSARGRMIVGLTGSTGDVVESIGLVHLK